MFAVYATEDILAEVTYRMRRKYPAAPGNLTSRIHDQLHELLDDRVADYTIDGSYPGIDPDDAHVHAAAVASGTGVVVTADSGFTKLGVDVMERLPYEVHTADTFFTLIDDSSPLTVRAVTQKQLEYFMRRDGESDMPSRLTKAGCPRFAQRARIHLQDLVT